MCSDSLARYLLRRKGSQGFTKNISWKCSIQSSSAVFSVFQRSNGIAHLHLMLFNYNPDLKFASKQYSSFHHWHDYQGGLKPRRKTRSSYNSYGAYHSIISVTRGGTWQDSGQHTIVSARGWTSGAEKISFSEDCIERILGFHFQFCQQNWCFNFIQVPQIS